MLRCWLDNIFSIASLQGLMMNTTWNQSLGLNFWRWVRTMVKRKNPVVHCVSEQVGNCHRSQLNFLFTVVFSSDQELSLSGRCLPSSPGFFSLSSLQNWTSSSAANISGHSRWNNDSRRTTCWLFVLLYCHPLSICHFQEEISRGRLTSMAGIIGWQDPLPSRIQCSTISAYSFNHIWMYTVNRSLQFWRSWWTSWW